MNKKGQSLVLFVLLLPIFFLLIAFAFDSAWIATNYIKFKNIETEALTYLVKDKKNVENVKTIILANDNQIDIINIDTKNVHLKKRIKSYFGKVVGKYSYEIDLNYNGYISNGKLILERK